MRPTTIAPRTTLTLLAVVILASTLLIASCSASDSNSSIDSPSSPDPGVEPGSSSQSTSSSSSQPTSSVTEQTDGALNTTQDDGAINEDGNAIDPMTGNVVVVNFEITVPVYASNALQVTVAWGGTRIQASWVGDELWAASDEFPSDVEATLTVMFNDDNGGITLGTAEQLFRTGTNDLEIHTITADQFDTESWDNDNDGVSNIQELRAGTDPNSLPRALLFSETQGFRHDSIESALVALEELSASEGIVTDRAGDSAGLFTDENLARYDVVVWALTSGDVLNTDEQGAFERYIQNGGGFAGIHAASDTEYEWPWYGALVGAYFARHPVIQSATQIIEDGTHTSTAHLSSTWTRTDEWYDYRENPRSQVNVLLSLDESSYTDGGMGEDHPSAWYHEFDGGRSWYTGGGHTEASYSELEFRQHLLGGLRYAAGLSQ